MKSDDNDAFANRTIGLAAAGATACCAGVVSVEAGGAWLRDLQSADRRDGFFATRTIDTVGGWKTLGGIWESESWRRRWYA